MKNSYARTKISIIFLGLLGLMTCMNQSPMSSDNFELVKDVYTVLAEKAITAQADFEFDAWAGMLAEDIEFTFPNDTVSNASKLVGKAAVIAYWKKWQTCTQIKTLQFSGFNHAPLKSNKKLNISGLSGIYVFSMFSSRIVFNNGEVAEGQINYCFHFNKDKFIDRCYVNYDRTPIIKIITHFPTCSASFGERNIRSFF